MLFITPLFCFGQYTAIPDTVFEQALINLGYDNVIDGQVQTTNIVSINSLDVSSGYIMDLTGIEDFSSLSSLNCSYNGLINLDVSNNTALTHLNCSYNGILDLELSSNTSLNYLNCIENNSLTTLNLNSHPNLDSLICGSFNSPPSLSYISLNNFA